MKRCSLCEDVDRLITFQSVHQAIKTERLLQQDNIEITAIPTPQEISVSCGQSLLFAASHQARVVQLLVQQQVQGWKLYKADRSARVYEKINETEG